MSEWNTIKNWEEAVNILDEYAGLRKSELEARQLSRDASLIKSYILETQANGFSLSEGQSAVQKYFRATDWTFETLDQDHVLRVNSFGEFVGFLELSRSRYLILHTLQKTNLIDGRLKRTVNESAKLDFTWLAGNGMCQGFATTPIISDLDNSWD